MRTMIFVAAAMVAGCGASAASEGAAEPTTEPAGEPASGGEAASETEVSADATVEMDLALAAAEAPMPAGAGLESAPWAADPLDAANVPRELLTAWDGAENREWCALLAPAQVEGARVRRSEYSGGWAVEFDKRGMPGMRANGRSCTRCGRGAFGIAGTAMEVDVEDPTEAEERMLADGSRVRIEVATGDEVDPGDAEGVVATLKIRGQDCVYQVWSFSGDQHLEQLLRELRFVDPR